MYFPDVNPCLQIRDRKLVEFEASGPPKQPARPECKPATSRAPASAGKTEAPTRWQRWSARKFCVTAPRWSVSYLVSARQSSSVPSRPGSGIIRPECGRERPARAEGA